MMLRYFELEIHNIHGFLLLNVGSDITGSLVVQTICTFDGTYTGK